jgi:hypothetical protein
MKEDEVFVGVDVAKSTPDIATSDSREVRQFANSDKVRTMSSELFIGLHCSEDPTKASFPFLMAGM